MEAKQIHLFTGKDFYCIPAGATDAYGTKLKNGICFESPKQGAVRLAFIDEEEGKPSVSHLCKEEGYGGSKIFRCMSTKGEERFKNFAGLELIELRYLEDQLQ